MVTSKDMSILKYVLHLNKLPSPTGRFAEDLTARLIRESNQQVQAVPRGGELQKRGMYIKYDNASHFAIRKYAFQNGGAATAKYSSRVFILSWEIFVGG